MESEGSEQQCVLEASPKHSFIKENLTSYSLQSSKISFYVRYVVKDVWIKMTLPRTETVACAKQMCLAKCGIASFQRSPSLPSLFSSSALSHLDTEVKSDDSITTETDWTTEYGLYWPTAGHWLDDSRRLFAYSFAAQNIVEVQHRDKFILLPMVNYFESYAEGYLQKKCGRGLSQCWSLRWFCLRGKLIYYSRRAKDSYAVINIHDSFQFVEKTPVENCWQFSIQLSNKALDLKATTYQDYIHWRRIFQSLQTKDLQAPPHHRKPISPLLWPKQTELLECTNEENKPSIRTESLLSRRTKSLLSRYGVFTRTNHQLVKSRNSAKSEKERVISTLRAYFQIWSEPEPVYIGVKAKKLYIFKRDTDCHEEECCISLENTCIEMEHSSGRFMFIFNIKAYAVDPMDTMNSTIGKLYVENVNEMKVWVTTLIEKAEIQISFGNIVPFTSSEAISSNRSSAPFSEFNDGYSTSPPTTPTSLSNSDLASFPFTMSQHTFQDRQTLNDNFDELFRTRSPSIATIAKQQPEDIEGLRYAESAPTSLYLNPHKKTSQRFPASFWKRRGSII